ISIPCCLATAVILATGPTRMGTMMPSSAAALAPRSEVSSQGWTTTVVAGGTSFASEISLSYLLLGGCPKGPPAVMAPISLSWNMLRSPLLLACLEAPLSSRDLRLNFPPRKRNGCCFSLLNSEQPANLAQPLLVLRRQLPNGGHHFLDHIKGFASRLGFRRKHGRNSSEQRLLIDQQHEVLIAD